MKSSHNGVSTQGCIYILHTVIEINSSSLQSNDDYTICKATITIHKRLQKWSPLMQASTRLCILKSHKPRPDRQELCTVLTLLNKFNQPSRGGHHDLKFVSNTLYLSSLVTLTVNTYTGSRKQYM